MAISQYFSLAIFEPRILLKPNRGGTKPEYNFLRWVQPPNHQSNHRLGLPQRFCHPRNPKGQIKQGKANPWIMFKIGVSFKKYTPLKNVFPLVSLPKLPKSESYPKKAHTFKTTSRKLPKKWLSLMSPLKHHQKRRKALTRVPMRLDFPPIRKEPAEIGLPGPVPQRYVPGIRGIGRRWRLLPF